MSDIFQPAPKPRTELGRYRLLSTTAGVRCSPLQLGAMNIGDAWSAFMGSMTKEQSFKLLDEYFQSGGNLCVENPALPRHDIWLTMRTASTLHAIVRWNAISAP